MTKKTYVGEVILVLLFTLVATVQCAVTGFGPQGSLFASTTIGVHGTSAGGPKMGSACVYSILGLIAFGNGSVQSASQNGGISKILSIDLDGLSVFGIFASQCTVVRGE